MQKKVDHYDRVNRRVGCVYPSLLLGITLTFQNGPCAYGLWIRLDDLDVLYMVNGRGWRLFVVEFYGVLMSSSGFQLKTKPSTKSFFALLFIFNFYIHFYCSSITLLLKLTHICDNVFFGEYSDFTRKLAMQTSINCIHKQLSAYLLTHKITIFAHLTSIQI